MFCFRILDHKMLPPENCLIYEKITGVFPAEHHMFWIGKTKQLPAQKVYVSDKQFIISCYLPNSLSHNSVCFKFMFRLKLILATTLIFGMKIIRTNQGAKAQENV